MLDLLSPLSLPLFARAFNLPLSPRRISLSLPLSLRLSHPSCLSRLFSTLLVSLHEPSTRTHWPSSEKDSCVSNGPRPLLRIPSSLLLFFLSFFSLSFLSTSSSSLLGSLTESRVTVRIRWLYGVFRGEEGRERERERRRPLARPASSQFKL